MIEQVKTNYICRVIKQLHGIGNINLLGTIFMSITVPPENLARGDSDHIDLISPQKLSNSLGAGQEQADEEADEHCYVDVCSDEGNKL